MPDLAAGLDLAMVAAHIPLITPFTSPNFPQPTPHPTLPVALAGRVTEQVGGLAAYFRQALVKVRPPPNNPNQAA